MLFNSYLFIFLFLPITLLVFFSIGSRGHHRIAIAWLIAASLFFYGWWNPAYLGLILASILFNYAVGVALANQHAQTLVSQSTQLNSTQLNSTQLNSTQLNSTQLNQKLCSLLACLSTFFCSDILNMPTFLLTTLTV